MNINVRRVLWPRLVPLALAAAVGMVGTWLATNTFSGQRSTEKERPASRAIARQASGQSTGARASAEGLSQSFREASRSVLPAVVVIKAPNEMACAHCGRIHRSGEWGDGTLPQEADDPTTRENSLEVLGSGFIAHPSGFIVTNHHVVASAQRIFVQLSDGRQFKATRLKGDALLDLAILKIEADTPLPTLQLADSEVVEVGDWVLAVGCPLELEQTVSAGIISAKNRSFCKKHQVRMLQTDAAINPGSSGGPLVNLDGQVVGITTSIASEDGGYQGIGFAVPASHAARLCGATGSCKRGRVNATEQSTSEIAGSWLAEGDPAARDKTRRAMQQGLASGDSSSGLDDHETNCTFVVRSTCPFPAPLAAR